MQVPYTIAGRTFALEADQAVHEAMQGRMDVFACSGASPDYHLALEQSAIAPAIEQPQRLWMTRDEQHLVITDSQAYRIELDEQTRRGVLRYRLLHKDPAHRLAFVGIYKSLASLLGVHLIHEGAGAILHAAGIVHHDCGLLFVGKSGAGKSTLASMVDPHNMLTDELVAITLHDNGPRLHATPFLGTLGDDHVLHRPLLSARALTGFALNHAQTWSTERADRGDVLRLLLRCMAVPAGDSNLDQPALDMAGELAHALPWYRLAFSRDAAAARPFFDQWVADQRQRRGRATRPC